MELVRRKVDPPRVPAEEPREAAPPPLLGPRADAGLDRVHRDVPVALPQVLVRFDEDAGVPPPKVADLAVDVVEPVREARIQSVHRAVEVAVPGSSSAGGSASSSHTTRGSRARGAPPRGRGIGRTPGAPNDAPVPSRASRAPIASKRGERSLRTWREGHVRCLAPDPSRTDYTETRASSSIDVRPAATFARPS